MGWGMANWKVRVFGRGPGREPSGPADITAVSASGTVTIKSLTGTWTGLVAGLPGTVTVTGTFVLTQSGTSISGTYSDPFGPGTISGNVSTTSPIVSMTISQQRFTPFVLTGTPNGSADAVTGVLNQSGFVNTPITINRQ